MPLCPLLESFLLRGGIESLARIAALFVGARTGKCSLFPILWHHHPQFVRALLPATVVFRKFIPRPEAAYPPAAGQFPSGYLRFAEEGSG